MIKYIDESNTLNTEINNYLYFLNDVCQNKKDVRRYVTSILRLYEKLDSLPVNYSNEEINSNRTLRKSSRYVNKIKKYVKKIKSVDFSVFKEAADKLHEINGQNGEFYRNRYSKEDWDSEQISRTLAGDINGIIKRKRKDILSSINEDINNSSDTIYFDDYNDELKKIQVVDDISDKLDENNSKELVDSFDSDTVLNNIDEKHQEISFNNGEIKDNKLDGINKNNSEGLIDSDTVLNNIGEKHQEISFNNDMYLSDDSNDYVERVLIKKELIELKKEIDHNEELFIELDHISPEQRSVIKSYISICEKYNKIDKLFHYIYDDVSSSDIVNIYENIFEFTGFLISELFEHIIHLSKVLCEVNSKSGLYDIKYIMDDSVLDVFGKYDLFIAKIQNFVKILNDKQGDNLSSSDKEMLSKVLWDKYRLDNINPSSIKEAVSLDLMSFVNENPFTLLQTIPYSKKKNEVYKKYDLDKIMENVDYSLEKYIPELFKSIKNKIMNSSLLSDTDKEYAVSNIILSFSKFIGNIHGLSDFPAASHDYLISYIMNKVFSVSSNLDGMFKECIHDIYVDENKKYKSLGFFDKIMYGKGKPKTSIIEKKLNSFTQKIDNISFSDE